MLCQLSHALPFFSYFFPQSYLRIYYQNHSSFNISIPWISMTTSSYSYFSCQLFAPGSNNLFTPLRSPIFCSIISLLHIQLEFNNQALWSFSCIFLTFFWPSMALLFSAGKTIPKFNPILSYSTPVTMQIKVAEENHTSGFSYIYNLNFKWIIFCVYSCLMSIPVILIFLRIEIVKYFLKGPCTKYFWLAGHTDSIIIIQYCHWTWKSHIQYIKNWLCFSKTWNRLLACGM